MLSYSQQYYEKNRTVIIARVQKYRKEHPEQSKATDKKERRNRRKEAINHYGGICTCCGERHIAFLTIDHINNNGAAHRKELKSSGTTLYRWLKRNNWPVGFQVLCYNCNHAKYTEGTCPHGTKKES